MEDFGSGTPDPIIVCSGLLCINKSGTVRLKQQTLKLVRNTQQNKDIGK